ncbi:MAG: L,D-transpeptidase family protein [Hyphomicrobiaceae bacterium]|nr:L,D-transpeptidase family protein [Hyphomicrobiaceae bacterium]
MQKAISFYSALAAKGGWPTLPDRVILRPGDSGPNVATLHRRLRMTGDLRASGRDDYTFDEALTEAVKRYQTRNGLEPNGIVYGVTQRLLNVPATDRVQQLQRNLQRIRELAPRIVNSPRHILMNAASFELQAIRNGQIEVASRTIAGKRTTPTPTVSARVQALNILPYWHVPGTIAKAQIIPAIRKDLSYLYRENIRVFSTFGGEEVDPSQVNWWGPESARYVFRQDPGPNNALGVLRFDMPNKHIVYMHDTPMKKLFGYFERAYSAGCVRVQSFFDLAEWVLAGQDGWTKDSLQRSVASGQPLTIKLKEQVPVHFIYLTAWVENGVVQFRNDLYNRDEQTFASSGDDGEARFLDQNFTP